jgi:signal transduction histidine kinase
MPQKHHAGQPVLAAPFTPKSDDRRSARTARTARTANITPRQALARLSEASHDLRDPLQVIASYTALIADGLCGPVTNEQRIYLNRMRGQVDHLAAVVGSILVLARLTEPGHALELSDVPARELLAEVHDLVEPFAAAAGVSLVADNPQTPIVVRGERTALLRVLANLAGNAVKFTPRGGRVSLSALALTDAVELHVADTGPGISPAHLDAIFDPFVQVQDTNAVERRSAGMGLGLSIARDLTLLMGGELFVRSTVGVGSVFVARFPANGRFPAEKAA